MSQKHYNANYLENTGEFLKSLKESTYQPFLEIEEGTIIDLGCGTGIDVLNMDAVLSRKIKLVGIDHDDAMLEKGRAANASDRVAFIQSEATNIPFASDSIAGLRAERLVQHLAHPEKVFDEIHRVLQKDHPLVIVETDWSGLIFYDENIAVQQKVIDYLTNIKINNGFASRKLIGYLRNSGFSNINIQVVPFILKTLEEANNYLWIEVILNEAKEKGYLSEEEHSEFVKSLKLSDKEACFACSINIVVVSSKK